MKCEICNKEFLDLGYHIKVHNISNKEYYDKFLNINNKGICNCGKLTKFINLKQGYLKFCSRKCSANSIDKKEKIKQTCIKRYGTENPYQNKEIQEKYKKTCLSKFGVDQALKSKEIQKKKEQTCLQHHGCLYPAQSKDISKKQQIKGKETNIKNERWLPDNQISNFRLYERKVNYYTYKSILSKFTKKELINRSKAGILGGKHIDHKFSIIQGFINGILPCIIGSPHNLEIINWKENIRKSSNCSINKEKLFKLYTGGEI